jgi:competence protein ComEC
MFWAVCVSFLLGVFVRSFLLVPFDFSVWCACIAGALFLVYMLDRTKRNATILCVAVLLSFAFGIERMNIATLSGDPLISAHLGERTTIEGTVVAEPDVREGSVRLSVAVNTLADQKATSTTAHTVGILVVAPPHTEVSYGDRIRASGLLVVPEPFDTGEGRQFAYPEYLAMQGIEYQLMRASVDRDETHTGNWMEAFAINLKHLFLRGLATALPEPAAGFAGGITVGDKRSLGENLTKDFQTVGLIHMVVLSGYNITVVLNAASWLLERIPFVHQLRFASMGLSGVIVTLFILMSGGASSAARSGLMAMIGVYARRSGRVFLASRALAAAGVSIVLYNPFTLCFDPGFQLSMLATLGLIVFTPLFTAKLQWMSEKFGLREVAASTLGTQIAVLPLLLYQNGQFSLYALPANLLTLIFVPYAMFLALIAGVAGIFLGPGAVVVGFPAYLVLQYIIVVAHAVARLPFASVSIGAFSAAWLFAAYACVFLVATYLHARRKNEKAPR